METVPMHGSIVPLGLGLIVLGAAIGIGKIGASALEGIARQPQAEKLIKTSMLLAAVLIEGIAVIALGICFLVLK